LVFFFFFFFFFFYKIVCFLAIFSTHISLSAYHCQKNKKTNNVDTQKKWSSTLIFFLGLVHYCFCWYSYKTLYLLLSYLSKLGKIGNLPVSNLILKLYAFDIFFIWVISLTGNKMVPVPCKSNGKDKEFEYQYKFLKIYRYVNLVK
jgi:hypothetical protein